ncbi:hypothetical protein ACFSQJ_18520 [Croceitalea marina]|uniref:Uncharacterized protein n=1 Tax=Croceitalea marina TaxID=1775166 RepID=A0ABW5N1H6_9FLAO
MKFIKNIKEIVYFDANAAEKSALLLFIEASIRDFDTYTIGISKFGTSKQNLEEMHCVISDQVENDSPVQMSVHLFGQMGLVAGAWQTYWFEHVLPEDQNTLEADKDTVYAVRGMFNECYKTEYRKMEQRGYITIELEQLQLDAIVRSFDYVLSNPHDIDFSMASFSALSYLEGLNDKFKTFQNQKKSVQIRLDIDDWATFFPYLEHAKSTVFNIRDAEMLDGIYEKYI